MGQDLHKVRGMDGSWSWSFTAVSHSATHPTGDAHAINRVHRICGLPVHQVLWGAESPSRLTTKKESLSRSNATCSSTTTTNMPTDRRIKDDGGGRDEDALLFLFPRPNQDVSHFPVRARDDSPPFLNWQGGAGSGGLCDRWIVLTQPTRVAVSQFRSSSARQAASPDARSRGKEKGPQDRHRTELTEE